jgi:hypothetical protein
MGNADRDTRKAIHEHLITDDGKSVQLSSDGADFSATRSRWNKLIRSRRPYWSEFGVAPCSAGWRTTILGWPRRNEPWITFAVMIQPLSISVGAMKAPN